MKIEIREHKGEREPVGTGFELRVLAEDGTIFTDIIVKRVFDVDIGGMEWMDITRQDDIEKIMNHIRG